MTGGLDSLLVATLFFVCGHFLLSSGPVRQTLVRWFGRIGFLPVYSLAVTAAFLWMVAAFGAAPLVQVWTPAPGLAWIPLLVMPLAILLMLAGVTTPNPSLVGAERMLTGAAPGTAAQGIISITRHPFLWGTTLWALSHLSVNGEAASMILMGGILTLSLGGMRHIDLRRETALGARWGPVKLTTSVLPFGAILTRRTRADWAGIGWWRPVVAVLVYAALLHGHTQFIGVSPLPG